MSSTALVMLGGAVAWSLGGGIAALLGGHGLAIAHPVLHLDRVRAMLDRSTDAGALVTVGGGGAVLPWLLAGSAVFLVWSRLVVWPVARRIRVDERAKALAQPDDVAKEFGPGALRRAARFTRPDLRDPRSRPATEFGFHLGHQRGHRRVPIWVDFEKRVRIIARPGWGKTSRLLVPIARDVPGAALIGSVKADLFEQTVVARQSRGQVRVVDFSDPDDPFAAGYPAVTWDPIPGCQNLIVATRRARALVSGSEDGDREDNDDAFWRNSAREVIEAWFHAAALAGLGMSDVLRWQENIELSQPKDILRDHPGAEPRARMALQKHLDKRAERTTSSVERFVILALGPFGTAAGRRFVGDERTSLDIRASIRDHETIYLLAGEDTAGAASPILTLFAEEWFYAARSLAAQQPGKRLSPPAVGVLDELRWLVPIPSLPAIAARDRAAGIGLVYALQSMRQETELYGPSAEALVGAVQVTLVGGYDRSGHQEITSQAGHTAVTSVSVGGGTWSGAQFTDSEQWRDVIEAADQQQLRDGESVLRVAGHRLMYCFTPSFRDDKALVTTITTEEASVRKVVDAARVIERKRTALREMAARMQFNGQWDAAETPSQSAPHEHDAVVVPFPHSSQQQDQPAW